MYHVVTGLIPNKDNSKYLLIVAKKDFGDFTGLFYPPGGHLEDGEDEKVALKREIFEELGIEITPKEKILESGGDVSSRRFHWWLCESIEEDSELYPDEVEIAQVRWFSKDEILDNEDLFWPATFKFLTGYFHN